MEQVIAVNNVSYLDRADIQLSTLYRIIEQGFNRKIELSIR